MEETKCKICNNIYNENNKIPKIINCGHTYCYECLKRSSMDKKFECFEDNEIMILTENILNKLPTNISLLKLIKNSNNKNNLEDLCPIHNKKLELICLNDNKQICSSCGLFGKHKNHNLINYEDFYNKITEKIDIFNLKKNTIKKKEIEINHQDFKDGLKLVLDNKIDTMKNKIDKNIDTLIEKLNNHKMELHGKLSEINKKFNKKLEKIFVSNINFKNKVIELNKKLELINNICNEKTNIDIKYLNEKIYENNEIEYEMKNLITELDKSKLKSEKIINKLADKWEISLNLDEFLNNIPNFIKIEKNDDDNLSNNSFFISKPKNKFLKKKRNTMNFENLLDLNPLENQTFNNVNVRTEKKQNQKSFLNIKKSLKKNHSLLLNDIKIENNIQFNINTNNISTKNSLISERIPTNFNKKIIKNAVDLSSKNLNDKDIINKDKITSSTKKLNLSNNKITDFGFKNLLVYLKNKNSLEYIDLSNNLLTDLSVQLFYNNVKYFKKIKKIILKENKINQKFNKINTILEKLKGSGVNVIFN